MIKIRRANERGHVQFDWLNTYHTFSFGEYYDPIHMGFKSLRVINDDSIKANSGFPFHSHMDMEIITYMIQGELEHKDSLNNTSVIRRGEIQLMRAGSGITHSEYNPSAEVDAHLLQIWIMPNDRGLKPLYQQKSFHLDDNVGKLILIASNIAENGSFTIAADAKIYAAILANSEINYPIAKNRGIWIHAVNGELLINNHLLTRGDGIALLDETNLNISGNGEFILFDLA